MTAMNIASALIIRSAELGFEVTNLKLSKLLYYVQAIALQRTGSPAYPESIEAWRHGPVVSEVYNAYKRYMAYPIDHDDFIVKKHTVQIDPLIDQIVSEVVQRTGSLGPWDLVALTHQTTPWKKHYRFGRNAVIPFGDLFECEINILSEE